MSLVDGVKHWSQPRIYLFSIAIMLLLFVAVSKSFSVADRSAQRRSACDYCGRHDGANKQQLLGTDFAEWKCVDGSGCIY